jgi:hypothetical protein
MARSRWFSSELLETCDLADNELGLSPEARRELISASLAGDAARIKSAEIWRLIAEWPEESDVPPLAYRFLPTDDKTAAEVYQTTQKPEWRRAILCMVWDEKERDENEARGVYLYRSTLDLAMKDADPACRLLAYAGGVHRRKQVLESLELRRSA